MNLKNKTLPFVIGLFLIGFAVPNSFASYIFNFENITHNSAENADIGEAQLSGALDLIGNDTALFTLSNTGPELSFIGQFYFDGTSFLGDLKGLIDKDDAALEVFGNGGVDFTQFTQGGGPPNLPGGNEITPKFDADIRFFADSPGTNNDGVDQGESLGIAFYTLPSGFDAIISAINSGDLRIGMHVQGFSNGGSESFVSTPSAVPEPTTMLLFGLGILGLTGVSRRKK